MNDDTAAELADALAFARSLERVLPVDHDADDAAERALKRYLASLPSRKLTRRP